MSADVQLVGILNITPDSFSDGGLAFTPAQVQERIETLIADGADIIDIGAESTRPGAKPVSVEEEWRRIEPALQYLKEKPHNVKVSIDTRHAATVVQALKYGVDWINDVSGFSDPQMIEAVRESNCMLVVMHALTVPADPAITLPDDTDVIEQLLQWAQLRVGALERAGIPRARIIMDPGIGFGKTAEQSFTIVRRMDEFIRRVELPVMVGHSRKSFLKLITSAPADQRDDQTLWLSLQLMMKGVNYLRVHDVARHVGLRSLCRLQREVQQSHA